MTSIPAKWFTTAALVAALGCAVAIAPDASAEDKSARERVQELFPQLQSDDDGVRKRAEDRLYALGEDGRREMERLTRSKDTQEAGTALRLLQSDRWSAKKLRDGERPLRRTDDERFAEIQKEMERKLEEARKRFERAMREMPEIELPEIGLRDIELPEIELPKIDLSDVRWSDIEWPRISIRQVPADASISISGVTTSNGQRLEWTRDGTGKTKVTITEKAGEPRVFEADSIAAFRELYPRIAGMLDDRVPAWTGGPTLRIFGGLPGIEIHQDPDQVTTGVAKLPAPVPVLGIGFEQPSAVLRHHLGIEGGVVVTRVLADSNAEKLGIQPMDVLVSVAGHRVSTYASIRAAMRKVGDGELSVEVIRRGERKTLRSSTLRSPK